MPSKRSSKAPSSKRKKAESNGEMAPASGAAEGESEELVEAVASDEPAPAGRKALGTKEIIPFRWKVVGFTDDLVVTLFKSTEQEDAQAQLERLRQDGYYTNLQIVTIDTKIDAPKSSSSRGRHPAAAVTSRAKPAATRRLPASKTAAPGATSRSKSRPAGKRPSSKKKGASSGGKRASKG